MCYATHMLSSAVTPLAPMVPPVGNTLQSYAGGASNVPTQRQTALGVTPTQQLDASRRYQAETRREIFSPRLGPSTITAERALEARATLGPRFIHNVMATRILQTSNVMAEAPKFRAQLDILA